MTELSKNALDLFRTGIDCEIVSAHVSPDAKH